MGCYIWYSEEGPGRAVAPPNPILAVPNVTAHPSTASVPITVLLYDGSLLCGFNVAFEGLNFLQNVHLSSSVVIVQIHQSPTRCLALGFLACVYEHLGEGAAVGGVVRAARPLKATAGAESTDAAPGRARTNRRPLADRLVAAATVEDTRATGARDGVRDTRRRHGMHERHLANTCRNTPSK